MPFVELYPNLSSTLLIIAIVVIVMSYCENGLRAAKLGALGLILLGVAGFGGINALY